MDHPVSQKEQIELSRAKIEICRIRIEEYDRNYFSLRGLEWTTTIQVLSAYVAVGVAHHTLRSAYGPNCVLTIWCILLPLALGAIYLYFGKRVQERLHYTRDMRNKFIAKLHAIIPETDLADNEKLADLTHGRIYAFYSQIGIHVLAILTLIVYVSMTAK